MRIRQWIAFAFGVALVAGATAAAQAGGNDASTDWEGLVKVKSKRFNEVLLLPGADFRGYRRVMLDATQVAFAKGWMRDMNSPTMELSRGTTAEEAERIAEQARTGFGSIFADAFRRAGYEVVAAPGADVLRLSPRVINLYINAPKSVTTSLRTRVYTVEAGEATLALEVRDSTTGALLGRVVDRQTAGDTGDLRLSITSTVSNRFNFERIFDAWARSCVKALEELKAQAPVQTTAPP